MAYTTANPQIRANGMTYSEVVEGTVGAVQVTIPEHAQLQPGNDGDFYNWKVKLAAGGNINVQAYAGEPGDTVILDAEVREKQLTQEKGGYKFIYLKLKPSQANAAVMQMTIARASYLRQIDAQSIEGAVTIDCPQERHDGGIAFAPIAAQLPVQRPTSHQVSRNKASA